MWKNSLKNQIVLFCAILVLITSVTSLAGFWWSTSQYNEKRILSDIDSAKNVYEQYLAAKENLLITAAQVLTADFGFKRAVATNDAATIASVLDNHGQRISADLMILTNLAGQLISSSSANFKPSQDMSTVVTELLNSPLHARFIIFDDTLYQVILLPVKAPRAIAYTLIGFRISDQVANDLKKLTGLEVTFIQDQNKVMSSSINEQLSTDIRRYVAEHRLHWMFGSRLAYINRIIPLNGLSDSSVSILLSASLAQTYEEFDRLLFTFLILAAATMLVCLILSGFLAKRLTVPLSRLVVTARRFAQGDYLSELKNTRDSTEIKQLFNAFTDMGNEIQQREKQITYQSQHDSLTGLYNRHIMGIQIDEILKSGKEFLILVIDIKGLKQINDKLGPQIGDDCIQVVAKRLVNYAPDGNENNGRIGGDEFLTILPRDKDLMPVQQVNDLLSQLNHPYKVRDLSLNLQFSCGVAMYPDDASDSKSLVRRATIASDAASTANEALRFYQTGEDEAHLERIAIVEDLKQALRADDGELFMHYQPKMSAQTGQVEKVEALIRWINREGKFIPPDLFIDLAEQAGLIIELTHWVINEVVKQVKAWQKQNLYIKASINVSAQDLTDDKFLGYLQKTIFTHDVSPKYITIELTERDMMQDERKALAAIKALKQAGFTISVDDYGVGQSSLSKLKQLPLDELKIDKSFILELDNSPGDQIIVRSTIMLGHNLGFSMVAEGVENQASLDLLIDMGCDHIQGYHISRPLAANDLTLWLEQYDVTQKSM
ncbi:putative bifunctional diguanylate cyclase/phosphodiesterase [Neptunicella sp.]|uniref:putative bifunctional diguanylate cyclase/phosphodiesterase n=1 Tax=Neptunicella sp. TaxID=2125986 RepID=UPI003F6947E6